MRERAVGFIEGHLKGRVCVEVADNLPGRVLVRDSKDPAGPSLAFGPAAWRDFVRQVAR